jgi:regulator of protease activity HflC (stomatin/prohibitin superfamily)
MAANLYKNVGINYPVTIIAPAIQESIKSVTANYTAEELITKRQDVSTEVKQRLDSKVEPYGIIVDNFNIVNFEFSQGFNAAIEQKQTAEQLALKAQRDLERVKIEAEQKVANAKAEAESLKVQRQEITPELLELRQIEVQSRAIEKWNGQLPTYSGGNLPFIQLQAK